MSDPTLDREPAVTAEGNGSHWVRELQAWRGRQGRPVPRLRLVLVALVAVVVLAALAYGVYWCTGAPFTSPPTTRSSPATSRR